MAYVQTSGGGRSWHKVVSPGVDFAGTMRSGFTAYSFTEGQCLTIDYSPYVPVGTVAVIVNIFMQTYGGYVCYRADGDTGIPNPWNVTDATAPWSNIFYSEDANTMFPSVIVPLSIAYKAQFSVHNTSIDLLVSKPFMVLI